MLKKIGALLAAVLVVVLLLAATKPDTFQVTRSATIGAPPDSIWPFLDDFHNWGSWSPWEKMDPAMTRTYSGAASGVGAVYAWSGNKKVGTGRMEIDEAQPRIRVSRSRWISSRPFESHNTAQLLAGPRPGIPRSSPGR